MSTHVSTLDLGLTSPMTILGRKIRVAVVGCGRISKNHFSALQLHNDDFELVAVCDSDPERKTRAASEYTVQGYGTTRELLRD